MMPLALKLAVTFLVAYFLTVPFAFATVTWRGGRYDRPMLTIHVGCLAAAAICFAAHLLQCVWSS